MVKAMSDLEQNWVNFYDDVVHDLIRLRERIDNLGESAEDICRPGRSRGPDEIACFASNGIEGTLALLRELRKRVIR